MKLYETLIEMFADVRAEDREIRFIDGENDESIVKFPDLWDRAIALLGSLQQRGMQAGDELIIFTKSNESFVVAFWAAVLGGIVPVPVAVGISDEHRLKLFRIVGQLDKATLFTELGLLERLLEFSKERGLTDITRRLESRTALMTDVQPAAHGSLYSATPEDTAFIQYSSGSTSDPKGVVLTHRNLCTNIRAIVEATGWNKDDQSLSWMPLTHDMGLIGYHLSVLGVAMNHAVMDTSVFVRRPLLWMSKANELRATQLCSPNFGYKHFLKLFQRKGLKDLDLSCVKLILNGAEPISWELCEEFLAALAPYGLKRTAMYPVYGLAEATVGVSIPVPGTEYSRITVDRHSLRVGDHYRGVEPQHPDAVSFVKVGNAIRDVKIRIADDEDKALADAVIGNIQLSGDSVTEKIYGDEHATSELFTPDGWLRTGDCGVFVDDQLVITGRQKDIIIVNGQNYYPHDIEEIVARLDGLELNKVVIAGATPKDGQTEELIVFILFRQALEDFAPLTRQVRDLVGEQAGLEVDKVIPVARIPKTTSGKVQRGKLLEAYLDGEFDAVLNELVPPESAAAATDDEPLVAELETICREFSKDRTIGADDNLFEVGVSSLTLTEIVLAIDEKYPGKLDISDLFDYPTLREIAAFLEKENLMTYARIAGIGSYLPEKIVTNHDLEKTMDTSDEWIRERTGIHRRHIASASETTSSMAVAAARRAMDAAGVGADDIDLIVLGTATPDKIFPATACIIQRQLGVSGCPAFDVHAACSGFIYGLDLANRYMKTGGATTALVIGSETLSRITNWEDRGTAVLFGDGAGAVVLTSSDEPGILATHIHADGQYEDLLQVEQGVSVGFDITRAGGAYIKMEGNAVFRRAVATFDNIARETIADLDGHLDDIDWFIPHQANMRIIRAAAKKLKLPMDRVIATVDQHANTSSASIPLALDMAVRDGRIKPGQTLLMAAFGAGFTWGSAMIKY